MGAARRFFGLDNGKNDRLNKALSRQSNTLRSHNITPSTQRQGVPTNENIKSTGSTFVGAVGYMSDSLDIATGILDLTANAAGDIVKVRKNIHLNPETGTTDTLDTISTGGTEFPGQELRLIGQAGNTITITHNSGTASGDNKAILCPNDTNYVIPNDNSVLLFYNDTVGKWSIEGDATAGGGGGDNLGDHLVRMNLDMNAWPIDNWFQINGVGTNHLLRSVDAVGITYSVPSADYHDFVVGTNSELRITATSTTFGGDAEINGHNVNEWLNLNGVGTGHQITSIDAVGIQYDVATNDYHDFQTNSTSRLKVDKDNATFGVDLDLQSTFNLLNFGFLAAGGSEATTGAIRLANNTSISWRNAANNNNLSFKVDDGNQFVFSTDFTVDVHIIRDESTPATGEIGSLDFRTQDSIGTETSFFNIQAFADVITNGSEDGEVRFTAKNTGTNQTFLKYDNGGIIILDATTENLGFFNSAGTTKQTITGSTAGNAALQNLLTALASHGIITDSTT